jgi:lactaldehyde dehydrogenase
MTVAGTLLEKRMLIDGEWVDADERTDVVHPYDGEKIGSVPLASAKQVNEAIDAAERAFEASDLSAYERYELLTVAADKLEKRADKVANAITSEQGKPITEARNEVDRAVQTMRFSAEEAKRLFGESVPMDPQKGFDRSHAFTQREPLGVVGAITPFNFPLNLMAHKLGPALAAGNAVVGKPATNTPLSSILLYECIEAGMEAVDAPDGLANVVTGSGSTVGDALLEHEAVEAISFTGSTAVGKYLADNSGMKEVTLELGGNDPRSSGTTPTLRRRRTASSAVPARTRGKSVIALSASSSTTRSKTSSSTPSSTLPRASGSATRSTRTPTSPPWSTTSSSRRSSTCSNRQSTPAPPSPPAASTAPAPAVASSSRPC